MVLAKGTSTSLKNNGGVKGSSEIMMHEMPCISMINPPEITNGDRGRFLVDETLKNEEQLKVPFSTCSPSSTSSIGKNSDISGSSKEENSGETDEVQSSYKGPLDAMEALEEVLPMRRGISNFYNGKSKSFASLADASSSPSIKDIAKPENAYMRKRRNLLASTLALDNRNRSSPLKSNGGGVSKRVTNSNRSTLALAVTMSCSISGSCNNGSDHYPLDLSGSPSSLLRARLHSQWRDFQYNGSLFLTSPRQNFSAWRSLSLADLQHCDSISSSCTAPTTGRHSGRKQSDT